jgi:hypothetical protein
MLASYRRSKWRGLKSSQIFFDHSANTWQVPGYRRRCAKGDEKEWSIVRLGTFRYPASAIEPD